MSFRSAVVLNLGPRFADRDMFMRYTYLGVGHATTLRRFIKDCLTRGSAHTDAMNVGQDDVGCEEVSDGEDSDQGDDDDEGEGSEDHEESDEDSDEDSDDKNGDEDGAGAGDDEEEVYDLSF
jgi:hypothetical protein